MQTTSRTNTPYDITSYAIQLANLNVLSDEVLLSLADTFSEGFIELVLRIIPHQSGELAEVEVRTYEVWASGYAVSENYRSELVPIQVINAFGNGLLAAARQEVFDFHFVA